MAFDWVSLIPMGVSILNDATGEKGNGGGSIAGQYDKALSIDQDSYNRVLQMLAEGKLEYDPKTATFVPVGPSAMAGVKADQQAVDAQGDALTRLGQASKEGYTDIDRAAINAIMNQANMNEKSQRDSQLARLDPNSGAAISARMGAQQASANTANQQALGMAANSRRQALAALSGYGNLATNMRGQSFDEQRAIAQANDAIAQFNARNSYGASQFNAGQANDAMQRGIANRLGAAHEVSGAAGKYSEAMRNEAGRQDARNNARTDKYGNLIAGVAKGISENGGKQDGTQPDGGGYNPNNTNYNNTYNADGSYNTTSDPGIQTPDWSTSVGDYKPYDPDKELGGGE